ncbi:MAG: DNA repair protein RadC [Proteobacteria bacterium]|nr:DNA repair protein RadC [Pseudomonadota bacterium]MBU1137427.1 DNA repair protein RadC [Pseudomonadota bacterium]MBU1232479.1 DNA repair protein RadC [Pseudomonadota bacterium]MBU1420232.1 DNA repair protein RadC [Pseudomonadota bacterium]MBU1455561.1 DNA repair protein RadC [Pseudomonadota bacterium]
MEKEQWQKKGAGHRQRLRDRFLERGLDGFTDAEVLELLLSFGTPRSDCKDTARSALEHFGSLAAVLEASLPALQEIKGIGAKNGFAVHFIQAVSRRYLKERLRGKRYLHSSNEVRNYLLHSLRGLKKEILTVIYLDSSHAILNTETVAEGTINVNTVYPRELVKKALQENASALIIAHNHPSGSLDPSPQDLQLTRTLALLGSLMQIQLLDHIIIGDGSFSFADHGLMNEISQQCRETMEGLHQR